MFNRASIPQRELNNRTFRVLAAGVVGGGSAVNGQLFDRGAALDYDAWRDLGNPGWGWNDLLPYFKKVRLIECSRTDCLTTRRAKISRHRMRTWLKNLTYRGIHLYMVWAALYSRVGQCLHIQA